MNPWTYMTQVGGWHDGGMFIGMSWMWWLFWVPAVVLVVWAILRLGGDRGAGRTDVSPETAEDTLRRRFARGEIDEEEYTRRLDLLRETSTRN